MVVEVERDLVRSVLRDVVPADAEVAEPAAGDDCLPRSGVVAASGVVVPEPVGGAPEAVVGVDGVVDFFADALLTMVGGLDVVGFEEFLRGPVE